MSVSPGHGLLIKGFFADGDEGKYPRPYLVINVTPQWIQALNVSSVAGKEHKLLFESNYKLNNYKPPFNFPSFVKLDVLYEIENFPEISSCLINPYQIDQLELVNVKDKFHDYSITHNIIRVRYRKDQLILRNMTLKRVPHDP